jgi:stage V sporulation protein G
MRITEVRVKLCEQNSERLLAFCSITLDQSFVIRDLKIIEGTRGLFVAMPSRKLCDRCGCGCKNHLKARFCNGCGRKLDEHRATPSSDGRAKLHADIAHPIHGAARDMMQQAVVHAYHDERLKAQQPGYVCRYDEFEFDDSPISYTAMVSAHAGHLKQHSAHAQPSPVHLEAEPVLAKAP